VEFTVDETISDEEAFTLIGSGLAKSKRKRGDNDGMDDDMRVGSRTKHRHQGSAKSTKGRWKESMTEDDVQVLRFDDDEEEGTTTEEMMAYDPFASKGGVGAVNGHKMEAGSPIVLGRDELAALHPTEILVSKYPSPLRYKFYRNLIPEMNIAQCASCFQVLFSY